MRLLDDGHILDRVSGAAPEAVRVLADCHAVLNAEAASRLGVAEAVFGVMLEGVTPAPLAPDARDRAIASAARRSQPESARVRDALFPRPLSEIVERQTGGMLVWKSCYGGREEIALEALTRDGVEASLIRLKPGAKVPRHDHDGEELTLVLSGVFSDGRDEYQRGEVCEAGPGVAHEPRAAGDEPCVCFAVTLGEVRPTNPLLAAAKAIFGRTG
jgi:putative transcriptional regulator